MNWMDFLFGLGMGALLVCALELVVLGIYSIIYDINARIKKLEDADQEEGT